MQFLPRFRRESSKVPPYFHVRGLCVCRIVHCPGSLAGGSDFNTLLKIIAESHEKTAFLCLGACNGVIHVSFLPGFPVLTIVRLASTSPELLAFPLLLHYLALAQFFLVDSLHIADQTARTVHTNTHWGRLSGARISRLRGVELEGRGLQSSYDALKGALHGFSQRR